MDRQYVLHPGGGGRGGNALVTSAGDERSARGFPHLLAIHTRCMPADMAAFSAALATAIANVRPHAVLASTPVDVRLPAAPTGDDAITARLGNSYNGVHPLVTVVNDGAEMVVSGQAQWVTALLVRWQRDVDSLSAGMRQL